MWNGVRIGEATIRLGMTRGRVRRLVEVGDLHGEYRGHGGRGPVLYVSEESINEFIARRAANGASGDVNLTAVGAGSNHLSGVPMA